MSDLSAVPCTARIDDILIGERVRKDMGDIASLAESIQRHGLLHPVVIKSDNTLVAGHRRLEAMRSLGWADIPVTIIDVADLLSAERDENAERKDFTPTEAVAIGRLIEEQHKAKIAAVRHEVAVAAGKASGAKRAGIELNAMPNQHRVGATDETAASAVGMGRNKYVQAKEIVAAAESDPETFGDLPAQMDETGNVHGTHQEMIRRKSGDAERKPRHPVHRKTHYPKRDREMERSIIALDGICTCLESIPTEELDASRINEWSDSLKKHAATINRVARALNGKN